MSELAETHCGVWKITVSLQTFKEKRPTKNNNNNNDDDHRFAIALNPSQKKQCFKALWHFSGRGLIFILYSWKKVKCQKWWIQSCIFFSVIAPYRAVVSSSSRHSNTSNVADIISWWTEVCRYWCCCRLVSTAKVQTNVLYCKFESIMLQLFYWLITSVWCKKIIIQDILDSHWQFIYSIIQKFSTLNGLHLAKTL